MTPLPLAFRDVVASADSEPLRIVPEVRARFAGDAWVEPAASPR